MIEDRVYLECTATHYLQSDWESKSSKLQPGSIAV